MRSIFLTGMTLLIASGTVAIWVYFLWLGLSGIVHLQNEGKLSFSILVVSFTVPAGLLLLYIFGLFHLYLKKTRMKLIFYFSIFGFFVWLFYIPVVMYIEKIFR